MVKVSIFTPIYNRSTFLPQIHNSLRLQTNKDFEWIVVDDGSTDDTKNIMTNIIKNSNHSFPITYLYKSNGGKHSAINMGIQYAQGELFFILDSDDSLPIDAIATVINKFEDVANVQNICGVCGLMAHHDGKIIGSGFSADGIIANSIELRYAQGVTGDLMEVFKTSILKKYPFPEIKGERFCPEALIWNRIAKKYKMKCFNNVICYRDYLEGGLTDNIIKIRMNSPNASMMYYSELCEQPIPFSQKLKAATNYWRFRLCAKFSKPTASIEPIWFFVLPMSLLMHFVDKRKVR